MSGAAITVPDMEAEDKLGLGVRSKPKPTVARVRLDALHDRDILFLLGGDEAPNFANLQTAACEVLKHAVLIPASRGHHVANELGNRRLTRASQTSDGAYAHSLAKEVNDLRS
jgi:hypothetical protein